MVIEKLKELRADRQLFSKSLLKIKTKAGQVEPFDYNKAQLYIDQKLDEQLEKTGKVRAYILKGRQQGCSTYVSSRYFHKAYFKAGFKVFILTHHTDATNNLFKMAKRYYQYLPKPMQPSVSKSNLKELVFDKLESEYKVATAGSDGAGRSDTIQLFHGSEVAFWPNAHEHAAGALQAVPDAPGTEIILESTANGIGNFFHQGCMDALRGKSDYQLIFVPWFWQPEYRSSSYGIVPDVYENELISTYGLDLEQIAWRRKKIAELKSVEKFKQEYPCSVEEAFIVSGHKTLIDANDVKAARKAVISNPTGPKILGVDVATGVGRDRSCLVYRQGRKVHWIRYYDVKEMTLVGHIKSVDAEINFDQINIDLGMGGGVYDRCLEVLPKKDRVNGINFGSSATEDHKYENKRAEMWHEAKDWFAAKPVQIPDEEELESDLLAPAVRPDSNSRIILESKKDMVKRVGFSPDGGDALALTFASPIFAGSGPIKPTIGSIC